MKKKNILSLVLALTLVAVLAVGGTLAYFTDNDSTSNTFTMGHVDINIDESKEVDPDTKEPIWKEDGLEYTGVVPGDKQPKTARVTVKPGSEDCYLMVKVAITTPAGSTLDPTKHIKPLYDALAAEIKGNAEWNWEVTSLTDGSLQCVYKGTDGKYIAHADEKPILFKQVSIPASFDNDVADQSFDIELNAFAVQSDNLDYDPAIWQGTFGELTLGDQAFKPYVPTQDQDAPGGQK